MVKVRQEHPLWHDGSLDIDRWLESIEQVYDIRDPGALRDALMLAKQLSDEAIVNQTYWTVDSVQMGLEMAQILMDLRLDTESIIAALLYRAVREGRLSLQKVEREFSPEVAKLIEGVLRMAAISAIQSTSSGEPVLGNRDDQIENLRKMLVAVIDDVRVALIKLAERTSAIRAAKDNPQEKRRKVAEEVFYIYAPLAHRLGIGHLKWELEDLAFRYMQPDSYKKIASLLDEKRLDRQKYIDTVVYRLKDELRSTGVRCDVYGRAKHIYSIWRKMNRKNLDFSQIYDIRALRILVDDVSDCYRVMGTIHVLWRPISGEFDDYIANPKENGYRSLHTAVVGPEGKIIEVQIRTNAMNEDAELGVCAHWLYKGTDTGGHKDQGYEQKISWLRQVLEWHEDIDDLPDLAQELRADINPDRIYVFTPDGHVVDLPPESTALDFAYRVHTEIGHHCRGAKINGRMGTLRRNLENGDQVEVLTHPDAHPSRDWLYPESGYLKTSRARAKVAQWFKKQARDKNLADGRQLVLRELDRLDLSQKPLQEVAESLNLKSTNDLFVAIGAGDVRVGQVVHAVLRQVDDGGSRPQELPLVKSPASTITEVGKDEIYIEGVGNLLTQIAKCCQPLPGDEISGFVSQGRGVVVHRSDCQNLLHMEVIEPSRVLQVSWGMAPSQTYPVQISILAYDRTGLLMDISKVMANEKVNVIGANTQSNRGDNTASMQLTVEIDSLENLSTLINKIEQLPNIMSARRVRSSVES